MPIGRVVVVALLVACAPIPEPRARPAGASEFCAAAGAVAPALHPIDLQLIDLHPIGTRPVGPGLSMSGEADRQLATRLAAMQARIHLPWATVSNEASPRLHRITDSHRLALFAASVAETAPWSGGLSRYLQSRTTWVAYVWDTTSDVWTFVGVGAVDAQLPRLGELDGGLFLGLAAQDLGSEAREPGYYDVIVGETARLRRLADMSAGEVTGMSSGMPVLWRRDGDAVVVSCVSTTRPIVGRRLALPEMFAPADGDAVRDQRLLLMQRTSKPKFVEMRPGPAFEAPVWILGLNDGRLRFIGHAPGQYRDAVTNIPRWYAAALAVWRDSRFTPFPPGEGLFGHTLCTRCATAYVDVASERVTPAT